tara:strand:- start:685 stop:1014 length:330 start_codon:yes stop_codon:yes gene_type:complete
MICHRPSCSKNLIDLPDSPNYASISIRCKCGARYRLSHKAGKHCVEKVSINDLTLAAVAYVKHSDMQPGDKVYILDDIIGRAERTEIANRESLRALVQVATSLKQNLLE